MKPLVTSRCGSHRVNPNYSTLLLMFDGSEVNVRPLGFRFNWQPSDDEVLTVVRELAFLSPTFDGEADRFCCDVEHVAHET
jgi:hypothetical protein